MEAKVLLIVGAVTRTSNSSHKKTAISSRHSSGFPSRYSRKVSSMGGVIDRGRPTPFEGRRRNGGSSEFL